MRANKTVHILGIAGSLRQSYNHAVLRAATQLEDATIDIFEVKSIPLFKQPEVMIGAADERFDTVGKLTDEETTEYVGLLVQSLVDWTRRTSEGLAR